MNVLTRTTLTSLTAAVAVAGAALPLTTATTAQAAPVHTTTTGPATTWTGGTPRTLRPGMRNVEVRALQVHLGWLGWFTTDPTGYYGPVTTASVKAYQRHLGLEATGIADTNTLSQLNGHLRWDLTFGRVLSAKQTSKGWRVTLEQVVVCIPGDTSRICRGVPLGGAQEYDDMDTGTTVTVALSAKATLTRHEATGHPLVQVHRDASGRVTGLVEQYRP